jgi:hypothetical protein
LLGKTQKFVGKINQLENEMTNHLVKAKCDIENLQNSHNKFSVNNEDKYINKININNMEYEIVDKNLKNALDEKVKQIQLLKQQNEKYIEEKYDLKSNIADTMDSKKLITDQIYELYNELTAKRNDKLQKELDHEKIINK